LKKILIIGAGKSAARLISYLLDQSKKFDWQITVGDINLALAQKKVEHHPNGEAVYFDVNDETLRQKYIGAADIVASLLPYSFHSIVAKNCLKLGKHLVTASYVDATCMALAPEFEKANLLFMGEIGLDPGIDHLATMKMVDNLKAKGAKITALYSYTGALIHPENDNNPWHYKFTWAPMNVITAGQGVSQYLYNNKAKYIPYNRIFDSQSEREIGDVGMFEVYPNRDSVKYMEKYNLEGIGTFLRGTLRRKGYCKAWNSFVQLGWTDNKHIIEVAEQTYTDLLESYLPVYILKRNNYNIEDSLANFLGLEVNDPIMHQMRWLGLFDNVPIALEKGTVAAILCDLLQEKWKLEAGDKDMIVMLHEIDYELDGEQRQQVATMVCMGEDEEHTAIAKTVGLPVGMMIKLIANEKVQLSGVKIPTMPEVYEPILAELAQYGILFDEKDVILQNV